VTSSASGSRRASGGSPSGRGPQRARTPRTPAARRERLHRVVDRLDEAYGRPVLASRLSPLGELVYTVLSQNTADVNTDRTYAELTRRFPTWAQVRDAPVDEVEDAIALGGLAHVKAPRIVQILQAVSERTGEPDLGELDEMSDDEALHWLRQLPGVGPKTAACVLLFALGRPAMPVDTHVHRVAGRLGLLDPGVSAEDAHAILTRMAGPDPVDIYAAHVDLVRHGRRICHARRPACDRCPVNDLCPSAFRV